MAAADRHTSASIVPGPQSSFQTRSFNISASTATPHARFSQTCPISSSCTSPRTLTTKKPQVLFARFQESQKYPQSAATNLVHFSRQPASSSSHESSTACIAWTYPAKAFIQERRRCATTPPRRICSQRWQFRGGSARYCDAARERRTAS